MVARRLLGRGLLSFSGPGLMPGRRTGLPLTGPAAPGLGGEGLLRCLPGEEADSAAGCRVVRWHPPGPAFPRPGAAGTGSGVPPSTPEVIFADGVAEPSEATGGAGRSPFLFQGEARRDAFFPPGSLPTAPARAGVSERAGAASGLPPRKAGRAACPAQTARSGGQEPPRRWSLTGLWPFTLSGQNLVPEPASEMEAPQAGRLSDSTRGRFPRGPTACLGGRLGGPGTVQQAGA